jgi:hypothetical protein
MIIFDLQRCLMNLAKANNFSCIVELFAKKINFIDVNRRNVKN